MQAELAGGVMNDMRPVLCLSRNRAGPGAALLPGLRLPMCGGRAGLLSWLHLRAQRIAALGRTSQLCAF